ncbi:MAG: hydantoinase/oxoprolinase family protein [Desulfovibrionaceae bacterium]|jgi:N-methylhydantoinase A/oxoprolinase/acetone carboxylase beta subunit
MLLGIDVGGTHTDAVALRVEGNKATLVAAAKVKTNKDDLLSSVNGALGLLLREVDPASVRQLGLSTTLSTNAIVENRTEDVGVLVMPGPGLDPQNYRPCRDFHVLGGSMDHRGMEAERLDLAQARAAVDQCREHGVRTFALVGKFSVRNPLHESQLRHMLCGGEDPGCERADFITLGHALGGALGFPRRVATAYFNCAVWRLYGAFATAVEESLIDHGLGCRVNILKADGGTMPLPHSRSMPVQSIFSGPAASVMGIVALTDIFHDSVLLDIGGTTTDIAIFAAGSPLVEPEGIDIGSHPTLVRALKVKSIGVGGDSAISVIGDTVRVGPRRLGPAMAEGGSHPTLTDALNLLGHSQVGDVAASEAGLAAYAESHTFTARQLAEQAVARAAATIREETRALLAEINDKPVYTIHELLEERAIVPRKVYVVGGPAQAMKMPLFAEFRLSTEVPENHAVANAVGAALTRTTTDLELFADTQRHTLFIPALGHRENIPASYTLEDAKRDAMNQLLSHLMDLRLASDASRAVITHASAFNMVDGMHTVGRNIRVTCQIKPGVAATLFGGRP